MLKDFLHTELVMENAAKVCIVSHNGLYGILGRTYRVGESTNLAMTIPADHSNAVTRGQKRKQENSVETFSNQEDSQTDFLDDNSSENSLLCE